jgi:hypothetical protein
MQNLVDKYYAASAICKMECTKLQECIGLRKIPKDIDELDDILKAIAFVENN